MKTKLSLIALVAGCLFAGHSHADYKTYQCGIVITKAMVDGEEASKEIRDARINKDFDGYTAYLDKKANSAKFIIVDSKKDKLIDRADTLRPTKADNQLYFEVRGSETYATSLDEDENPVFVVINTHGTYEHSDTYGNCVEVK